jgi:hypothetical protein
MSSSGISVMLCCAEDDEERIAPVLVHLTREGLAPQVLAGVDKEAQRLGQAVDTERGRCLFVACQSQHLGPPQILRLEGIFGARRGPGHRFIGARLDPHNPLQMVKAIRAALATFSVATEAGSPDEEVGRREVIGLTGMSALGSDARSSQTIRDRMADRQTPADPIAVPLHGKAAELSARVPPQQSGAWRVPPAGDTMSEGARAASPAPLVPDPTAPSSRGFLAVSIGIAALALLGLGYLALRDRGPERPAPAPESPRAGQAAGGSAPHPTEPPPQPVERVVSPPPEEPGPAPIEAVEPPEPPPPAPALPEEDAAVAAAIENGEMRALDLILVAPAGDARPWREAATSCRARRIREIGGWRLPSVAELKKLRGARMLKAGRYWSSTLAVQGSDDVYVLDAGTRKVEVVPKDAPDVRALCVRGR